MNPLEPNKVPMPLLDQQQTVVMDENSSNEPMPLSKKRTDNPFYKVYSYVMENKDRKTYTIPTLTFAFISILIIFAIFPTVQSIAQIVQKIDEYRIVDTKQKDKLKTLVSLDNTSVSSVDTGGLSEAVSFLDDTFLPNDTSEDKIFENLIDLSRANGITIISLKTSPTEVLSTGNIKQLKTNQYDLSASSTKKENIQSLINSLLNTKILYKITAIQVTSPSNDGKSQTLEATSYTANITLLAYYYV